MQQFIATYGYLAIFVLMLAESACIPVPSELIMTFGGALAAGAVPGTSLNLAGVIMAGRQIIAAPLSGPSTPLLFVHGRRDQVVDYRDGHAVYAAVTWPKAFLTFPDCGHVATGAELDVVIATSTDFWRWSLYGDPAAKARLARDASKGGHGSLADKL